MKTSNIPAVRVAPELRAEIEGLLNDGESLSQFVEASVRAAVRQRREQGEFMARGMRSLAEAKRTGEYFDAGEVMQRLKRKLATAKGDRKPRSP